MFHSLRLCLLLSTAVSLFFFLLFYIFKSLFLCRFQSVCLSVSLPVCQSVSLSVCRYFSITISIHVFISVPHFFICLFYSVTPCASLCFFDSVSFSISPPSFPLSSVCSIHLSLPYQSIFTCLLSFLPHRSIIEFLQAFSPSVTSLFLSFSFFVSAFLPELSSHFFSPWPCFYVMSVNLSVLLPPVFLSSFSLSQCRTCIFLSRSAVCFLCLYCCLLSVVCYLCLYLSLHFIEMAPLYLYSPSTFCIYPLPSIITFSLWLSRLVFISLAWSVKSIVSSAICLSFPLFVCPPKILCFCRASH